MTEGQQELAPAFPQHHLPSVLHRKEICLPFVPRSHKALPGLQVFALVVSTASKAVFTPRPHEAAFLLLLSSQSRRRLLSKVPPGPPLKRSLCGSPLTIVPCSFVFITLFTLWNKLVNLLFACLVAVYYLVFQFFSHP